MKMGISYSSEEGIKLAGQVMEFIDYISKTESIEMAKERGSFNNFKGSIYDSEHYLYNKYKGKSAGKISDEVLGLFHELEGKGHFSEVKNVLNYFCEKIRKYRRIGRASVITPMELASDKKQEVQKKLLETTSYKSLDIEYSVDSSLIGGMVIRIGDRVVDSSIKSKLDKLSHELSRIQLKVGETDS
jgi:F-type H+-transporting ATPase subunit delta